MSAKASAKDLDRLATVENVQREALDPIDEAEAFAKLLTGGSKIEDVSIETGVSVQTIRRRLALADLAPEAKAAVRGKVLSLTVAEALTLATPEHQKQWLKDIKRNPGIDARYLRSMLLEEKPSAAIAIFALERYQGTYTRDLFAEKDATYFDDREQFLALQREAVQNLAEEHRKSFAWVEVVTDHTVSWWQYREAKKKEPGGVVIHLSPAGRVEVRKNLVRQEIDPKATNGKGHVKKPKERPAVSKATYRYANAHKTLAMQMALMGNPRKAKEVTAMLLLSNGSMGAEVKLGAHEALREVAKHPDSSKAYATIEKTAQKLLQMLGVHSQAPEGTPAWLRLPRSGADWTDLVSGIRSLNGIQLDCLIALLVIECFGTKRMEGPEPEGTLFMGLLKDLTLNMREVWTPDAVFLNGLRRDELVKIAGDCGALRKQPRLGTVTKTALVDGLASYFTRTADPKAVLDEDEAKGRSWLPELMTLVPSAQQSAKNA